MLMLLVYVGMTYLVPKHFTPKTQRKIKGKKE